MEVIGWIIKLLCFLFGFYIGDKMILLAQMYAFCNLNKLEHLLKRQENLPALKNLALRIKRKHLIRGLVHRHDDFNPCNAPSLGFKERV